MINGVFKGWKGGYNKRQNGKPSRLISKMMTLLLEDNKTLGCIVGIHPGKDGFVRVVTINTKNSIFKRPITEIAMLPLY